MSLNNECVPNNEVIVCTRTVLLYVETCQSERECHLITSVCLIMRSSYVLVLFCYMWKRVNPSVNVRET